MGGYLIFHAVVIDSFIFSEEGSRCYESQVNRRVELDQTLAD